MIVKKLTTFVAGLFLFSSLVAQGNFNLEFISQTTYPSGGNDIWGYVDKNGVEYGIVGSRASTLLYSLADPSAPELVYEVLGAFGTWRDMKNVGDYLYITADQGSDGLLIIDMTEVDDTITHVFYKPTFDAGNGTEVLRKVHNLYADDRYVYLSGFNDVGGVLILDTETDPLAPEIIGFANDTYSHDVYVQDSIMYASEIYLGVLGIYDIKDPTNPVLLARQSTTSNFTHNAWASASGNYVFTTDERRDGNVDAYDISDLDQIKRLDFFQPYRPDSAATIPHNTHYFNGFLVTSWYEDGVIIIDANKPDNLVEVAAYDTYLGRSGTGSGFNGCWGVTPYLPSGLVIANDINSGFYVLEPTYVRASYLEGVVINSLTKEPILSATVEIISQQANTASSDIAGIYKTGIAYTGDYEVVVSHPEYNTKRVMVNLRSAEVTDLTVELSQSFISGGVKSADNGEGIPFAKVTVYNPETNAFSFAEADDAGGFVIPIQANQEYELYAGSWGFKGMLLEGVSTASAGPVELLLERGYEDDFFADLGWQIITTASVGEWELGIPNGTVDGNRFSNPNVDVEGDLGPFAYVTGNSGVGLGDQDVDGGSTTLVSPLMDFSDENIQKFSIDVQVWWYNCCGNGTPDDTLYVSLLTGSDEILLDKINGPMGTWIELGYEFDRQDIDFTSTMQLMITAGDEGQGHIVEAGVDQFRAEVTQLTSNENLLEESFGIYPNPALSHIYLELTDDAQVQIIDMMGRILYDHQHKAGLHNIAVSSFSSGQYALKVINADGQASAKTWVKH